jgi:hypothetical protein
MRLGNAIRLLKLAGFKHYAINIPPRPDGLDTTDLEVLVTHPVHGKCPAVRVPIFPGKEQSMLDWQVTGDLVFVIINQFCPVSARLGAEATPAAPVMSILERIAGEERKAPAVASDATPARSGDTTAVEANAGAVRETPAAPKVEPRAHSVTPEKPREAPVVAAPEATAQHPVEAKPALAKSPRDLSLDRVPNRAPC